MAVTILETIKSKANAGNTAYIVILQLLCDTAADLPTQYSMTGYELAQGCKAHVIDTNSDYMLDSSGTWHISGGEIWQNVYTKTETDTLLAGKQDTLTTAQLDAVNSGITAARLAADESDIISLKHMVDPRSQSQVSGGNLNNATVSENRVYVAPSGLPADVSASSVCIAETCVVDSNSAYQIITLLSNQGTAQNRSYPTYKRVKVGGVWYDWKLIVS